MLALAHTSVEKASRKLASQVEPAYAGLMRSMVAPQPLIERVETMGIREVARVCGVSRGMLTRLVRALPIRPASLRRVENKLV